MSGILAATGRRHTGDATWTPGSSTTGPAPALLIKDTAARIRAAGYAVTIHVEDDDEPVRWHAGATRDVA